MSCQIPSAAKCPAADKRTTKSEHPKAIGVVCAIIDAWTHEGLWIVEKESKAEDDTAPFCLWASECMPDRKGLLYDFCAVSKEARVIDSLESQCGNKIFGSLSHAEVRRLFAQDWEAFYREFPSCHGILIFSGVGFSADGCSALIYVEKAAHELEEGRLIYLENEEGQWCIKKSVQVWIS